MMIKYYPAPEIDSQIREIAEKLDMKHDLSRIVCIRSKGSSSRRTLARCHALPRVMQIALNVKAHYVIEVISENFDKLDEEDKTKTLIHELLHIPKAFGGGFKYHNCVNRQNVEKMYKKFLSCLGN
jgi:predicted metallopeptidase